MSSPASGLVEERTSGGPIGSTSVLTIEQAVESVRGPGSVSLTCDPVTLWGRIIWKQGKTSRWYYARIIDSLIASDCNRWIWGLPSRAVNRRVAGSSPAAGAGPPEGGRSASALRGVASPRRAKRSAASPAAGASKPSQSREVGSHPHFTAPVVHPETSRAGTIPGASDASSGGQRTFAPTCRACRTNRDHAGSSLLSRYALRRPRAHLLRRPLVPRHRRRNPPSRPSLRPRSATTASYAFAMDSWMNNVVPSPAFDSQEAALRVRPSPSTARSRAPGRCPSRRARMVRHYRSSFAAW